MFIEIHCQYFINSINKFLISLIQHTCILDNIKTLAKFFFLSFLVKKFLKDFKLRLAGSLNKVSTLHLHLANSLF